MKRLLLILIAILGLIVITYLCFTNNAPIIEEELTLNTNRKLQVQNLEWAKASADGQIITLNGIAPNQEAKQQAAEVVQQIDGVSDIKNEITLTPFIPKQTSKENTADPDHTINNQLIETVQINNETKENCQQRFNDLLNNHSIKFQTASTQLSYSSLKLINSLSEVAQSCSKYTIIIEGHTDSIGDTQLNKTLSQLRANSVRDELITLGITADTLIAIGIGEDQPIADNTTDAGRKLNRRIEFKVEEK